MTTCMLVWRGEERVSRAAEATRLIEHAKYGKSWHLVPARAAMLCKGKTQDGMSP